MDISLDQANRIIALALQRSAEARYQNFSAGGDPFSGERESMTSGYLGLGFRL